MIYFRENLNVTKGWKRKEVKKEFQAKAMKQKTHKNTLQLL